MTKKARSLLLTAALAAFCPAVFPGQEPAGSFPVLRGPYLGQEPPGAAPEVFAPGVINTGMFTRDVAMTPDGSEFYFGLTAGGYAWSTICVTRLVDGRWTPPEVMPHMDDPRFMNFEPCISPDGKKFYFLSNRPDSAAGDKERGDQDIWAMDRVGDGWGTPYNLGGPVNTSGEEYFPSVTRDGTLYFTRTESDGRTSAVYRARFRDGSFQEPEKLPPQVNCGATRYNAFIAPDESYIIVPAAGRKDSLGGTDYYVVFRGPDDSWSEPVHMGPAVNSAAGQEFSPYVSPDGKYFFFMSNRFLPRERWPAKLTYAAMREAAGRAPNGLSAIYWTDAGFIETLRPKTSPPAVATCVWEEGQFAEALVLAESLRAFGGRLARAPFSAYVLEGCAGPDEAAARKFKEFGVEIITFSAPEEARDFPFAAKIFAAARAEAEAEGRADVLAWLDPDTVIWEEPGAFLLDRGKSLGCRPVMHQLIGSSFDRPPDPFWSKLYELFAVKPESLFPMTTPVDRAVIRPYVNAGLLIVRPERGLLRAWKEGFLKCASDPVLTEQCRADRRKLVFLHQAALAGALTAALPRAEMSELPETYNYPLNLHSQIPLERRPSSLDGFVSLRYDAGGRVAELIREGGLTGRRAEWLLARFSAQEK